jgi:hypothetical protein
MIDRMFHAGLLCLIVRTNRLMHKQANSLSNRMIRRNINGNF